MAAIDMGTNSFHMVVVNADETGSFAIVSDWLGFGENSQASQAI